MPLHCISILAWEYHYGHNNAVNLPDGAYFVWSVAIAWPLRSVNIHTSQASLLFNFESGFNLYDRFSRSDIAMLWARRLTGASSSYQSKFHLYIKLHVHATVRHWLLTRSLGFIAGRTNVRIVVEEFILFSSSVITPPLFHAHYTHHLRYAIALIRQHIITSSIFKLGGFISETTLDCFFIQLHLVIYYLLFLPDLMD